MYLLGFPQLDPTSGDGFGAVSPGGNPWSTARKSASTVFLILGLPLTSIPRNKPVLSAAAWSFQMLCWPKVWRRSLFKGPWMPLLLTSFAWKKNRNSPPKQMCGFAAAEGPLPPLSVYPDALGQTGRLFLVTRRDSSALNIILRPFPNWTKFWFGPQTKDN